MPDHTKLTAKQEAFVREYLTDLNGKQAAIRAGYSAKTAESQASTLLRNPKVKERVEAETAARLAKLDMKSDDVIQRLKDIVSADTTKLTALRYGSCRYCWGENHQFQWKTKREFDEAVELATAGTEEGQPSKSRLPSDEGGFGYRITRDPNPGCPECAGLGEQYVRFADTSKLTGPERLLFESVQQTKDGIKFHLADRGKALDLLAKHYGLLKEKVEHNLGDGMAEALADIWKRGSKAPITRRDASDEVDE